SKFEIFNIYQHITILLVLIIRSKYQFVPPDLHWARKNFEKRGAVLLKKLLGKARASRVKPQWIGEVVCRDGNGSPWGGDIPPALHICPRPRRVPMTGNGDP
ncbi:hypothetical protein HN51_027611, partial [Arachis hypogaea]